MQVLVFPSNGRENHVESSATRQGVEFSPGQTVQIAGRGERFMVLRVDRERHVADLLRQGALCKVKTGIWLALLTLASASGPPDDTKIPA